MLTTRFFNNTDPRRILDIWSEKFRAGKGLLAPLSAEILEEQILGSILFDPRGFLLAFDNDLPVGFIHATPDSNWNDVPVSNRFGLIFPPVVAPSASAPEETARLLVLAAENYLREKKTAFFVVVNGYPTGFPFYDVLYGSDDPNGLLPDDTPVRSLFQKWGYRFMDKIHRFRLDVDRYKPPVSNQIYEVYHQFSIQKIPSWKTYDPWAIFCFRNFFSQEWNVFQNNSLNEKPIAGAVLQYMKSQLSSSVVMREGPFKMKPLPEHYVLSMISVAEEYLRRGIGSALLATVVHEIRNTCFYSAVVETFVEGDDSRMIQFLKRHSFEELPHFHSMIKPCRPV